MRSLLLVCLVLLAVLTQAQAEYTAKRKLLMAPYVAPSQSPSPSPRPARTDFVDLSFTTEDEFVPDRFDDFATSFFQYFGLTSLLDGLSTVNYYELDDNGDGGGLSSFDFNANGGSTLFASYSVTLAVSMLLLVGFALV